MRTLPLLLVLAGCVPVARATVHEVCSGPTGSRYRDYDQCYAEISKERAALDAEREEAAQRHFKQAREAFQSAADAKRTTVCRDFLGTIRCEEE